MIIGAYHAAGSTADIPKPLAAVAPAPIVPKLKPTAAQLKTSKVPVKYVSSITASETRSPTKAGVYIVSGPIAIPKGKTLTIAASTIIKLSGDSFYLKPQTGANLTISGSASNPVIFTSVTDDPGQALFALNKAYDSCFGG